MPTPGRRYGRHVDQSLLPQLCLVGVVVGIVGVVVPVLPGRQLG